ncbi:unnamed protein product [marine sediment metagenome]|uniref:Uncharacterized protein n=1 Tax=marine sediment metagenome TaxID=412755 RepID=X1J7L9_9ZZZZ
MQINENLIFTFLSDETYAAAKIPKAISDPTNNLGRSCAGVCKIFGNTIDTIMNQMKKVLPLNLVLKEAQIAKGNDNP